MEMNSSRIHDQLDKGEDVTETAVKQDHILTYTTEEESRK